MAIKKSAIDVLQIFNNSIKLYLFTKNKWSVFKWF